HTSLQGFKVQPVDDYLDSRKPVLINKDLHISLAAPRQSMDRYFYKNSQADEVIFVHEGTGKLKTGYGEIPFEYGDYLLIPRGVIYHLEFGTTSNRVLSVKTFTPVRTPKRYRNDFGQLMEHSPFCERVMKLPHNLQTYDELGDFEVRIKKEGLIYPY